MNELFYTKLAKYYDRIYHYIEYDKQVEFFIKVIEQFNKSGSKSILDVACGTGTHSDLLQKRGFDVIGLDVSEEMLREAGKKNPKVRFVLGDMNRMKLDERFGTIICFFNSILYSKNPAEMRKTLSGFHKHLEDGGIAIFDFVDKATGIKSKKQIYRYDGEGLKISFIPQWIYNRKDNVMDLEIDFFINNKKMHDHHVMGAFSLAELRKIAEEIGFEVFVLERKFDSIERYHSGENLSVFVCRKRQM